MPLPGAQCRPLRWSSIQGDLLGGAEATARARHGPPTPIGKLPPPQSPGRSVIPCPLANKEVRALVSPRPPEMALMANPCTRDLGSIAGGPAAARVNVNGPRGPPLPPPASDPHSLGCPWAGFAAAAASSGNQGLRTWGYTPRPPYERNVMLNDERHQIWCGPGPSCQCRCPDCHGFLDNCPCGFCCRCCATKFACSARCCTQRARPTSPSLRGPQLKLL